MKGKKRNALEAAGYQVGDVRGRLGLSAEERPSVELRAAVSAAVREWRAERNRAQAEMAERLRSSRSRVAQIEAGSGDLSLDLLFHNLFAVGGRAADVLKKHSTGRAAGSGRPPAKKKTLDSTANR